MPTISGISHLLLDIEGTTCPVSFVADTLFPYAATRLSAFLLEESTNPEVQRLVAEAEQAWRSDPDPEAITLRQRHLGASPAGVRATADSGSDAGDTPHPTAVPSLRVAAYLQLLIQQDRKLTPLKDLQGLIWRAGYADGDLSAPLFGDVPAALQRWHDAGVELAVYSSGSVPAQQLLYGHTESGDLRPLFNHWFDTRTGAKQLPESYRAISRTMNTQPQRVLFISDALAECEAACQAGMAVLFSDRPGNPQRASAAFEKISNYTDLVIEP